MKLTSPSPYIELTEDDILTAIRAYVAPIVPSGMKVEDVSLRLKPYPFMSKGDAAAIIALKR
jgi:hypothetical protein